MNNLLPWKKQLVFSVFLPAFVFLNSSSAFSYSSFDSTLAKAYTNIFNLDFIAAEQLLKVEKTEFPRNDLSLLFEGNIEFLKSILSERESDFELFKRNNEIRFKKFEKNKDEGSPFYLYAPAELMIQEAIVKVKFREYVSAVSLFVKANNLIEKNKAAFPTFPLNTKLSGLINVVAGSVPKQFQWLSDLAGIHGTVEDGKKRLQLLYRSLEASEFSVYRPELLFYLTMIESVFSINDHPDSMLLSEYNRYANSGLLAYSHSNLLMKSGRNDEAIQILNDAIQNEKYAFRFLNYKRGLTFLRRGEWNAAKDDFSLYANEFTGVNYLKSSYQKLSWIALFQNDTRDFFYFRNLCKSKGGNLTDEDKDALHEALSEAPIDTSLLKSRVYFDGGYYSDALRMLLTVSPKKSNRIKDRLEYTYRMGRIMEKTGRTDQALLCYQTVFDAGKDQPYYFVANSALLSGTIYERQMNREKAAYYYKLVLSMKDHEYRNSIDQKAKAGLERIKF